MIKREIVKWLENLKEDIGQPQHQDLWHYAEALDEAINVIESLSTIEVSEECMSIEGARKKLVETYIKGYLQK